MELHLNSHSSEKAEPGSPSSDGKGVSRLWVEYYAPSVLLLIAAFIVLTYVFLRPMILDIKEMNAEIAQRLQTLERQRLFLGSLSQSIAASRAISPEALLKVNRALPSDTNIPLLLIEFGTSAASGM